MSDLPRSGTKDFRSIRIIRPLTNSVSGRFLKTVQVSVPLDRDIASEVTKAILNWGLSFGGTHDAH
jgi:hypothetical protein